MSTHTPETSSLAAAPAYDALAVEPAAPGPLRAAITAAWRRPEPEALAPLLARAQLPAPTRCAPANAPAGAPASCRGCCRNLRCPRKKGWR